MIKIIYDQDRLQLLFSFFAVVCLRDVGNQQGAHFTEKQDEVLRKEKFISTKESEEIFLISHFFIVFNVVLSWFLFSLQGSWRRMEMKSSRSSKFSHSNITFLDFKAPNVSKVCLINKQKKVQSQKKISGHFYHLI